MAEEGSDPGQSGWKSCDFCSILLPKGETGEKKKQILMAPHWMPRVCPGYLSHVQFLQQSFQVDLTVPLHRWDHEGSKKWSILLESAVIETQACLTPDPRAPSTTPSMHGDTASPVTSSSQPCSGNKDRDVRAGMGAHRVGAGLSLRWLTSG